VPPPSTVIRKDFVDRRPIRLEADDSRLDIYARRSDVAMDHATSKFFLFPYELRQRFGNRTLRCLPPCIRSPPSNNFFLLLELVHQELRSGVSPSINSFVAGFF